jgi:hypothetical protein
MFATGTFWSNPGVWIAIGGGVLMAANLVRAVAAPVQFAAYFGLPLDDERDIGFVHVYGLRALFVLLILGILIHHQDARLLGAVCLAATTMAVGDAWLTSRACAHITTILRHCVIALALVSAGVFLQPF